MVFFSIYETDVKEMQEKATQDFNARGSGKYAISDLCKIHIEIKDSRHNWEKLLSKGLQGGPKIELKDEDKSIISAIEFSVKNEPDETSTILAAR
jgi:hypothetical protein